MRLPQARMGIAAALLCSLAPAAALAQHHGDTFGAPPSTVSPCSDTTLAEEVPSLQKVDMAVTASGEARRFFSQGMTLLYAFNHQDAMRAFRKAAAVDDLFAMAHWGIALAAGPNINVGIDPTCQELAHREVEAAWKRTQERQVTAMERDLIGALRQRYSGAPYFEAAYKAAMAEVARNHPRDPDVLSLYAESIMDLRPWGLYNRVGEPAIDTQVALHQLLAAKKIRPDHIGANHYLIHAIEAGGLDAPQLRKEALEAANLLRTRVPDAGHLLHMPSHIFMRLGRYDDAAQSNRDAVAADERTVGKACPGPRCLQFYYGHYLSHNLSFQSAAAAMEGRRREAIAAARRTSQHAADYVKDERGLEHYLATYWMTLVNFRCWDRILVEAQRARRDGCPEGCPQEGCHLLNAMIHWAEGMALAATGKPAEAEERYKAFNEARNGIFHISWGNNTPESVLKIADNVLRARIAAARNDLPAAIEALSVAVSLEDDLIYDEPPTWLYPARQAWGGALIADRRYADAAAVFQQDLESKRNPHNGRSLFGLANALKGMCEHCGDKEWTEYKKAWRNADPGFELTLADLWCQPAPGSARPHACLPDTPAACPADAASAPAAAPAARGRR